MESQWSKGAISIAEVNYMQLCKLSQKLFLFYFSKSNLHLINFII